MSNYSVRSKKGTRRDFEKIKCFYLGKSFLEIIQQLKVGLYNNNQSFDKLVPPLRAFTLNELMFSIELSIRQLK